MVLKIFKAVWFLSMLVTLANLLYVYAGLPQTVTLLQEGPQGITVSREVFFYSAAAVMALVNAMVYPVSFVYRQDTDFRTWFHGLTITLNFFFIIAMNFVGLYNSGERFDYGRLHFIVYGSIALFLLWALGWPVYRVIRRVTSKQPV
jgi:hypothetical protein